MTNLLLFGGTFDPIHYGHLHTALAVQRHFQFDQFVFLPCKIPLLKKNATATPAQRVCMLNLALTECMGNAYNRPNAVFVIDEREIRRETPSYTLLTLKDYRQQVGEQVSITWLMGEDSFHQLPQWENWEQLLIWANLLVIQRPQVSARPAMLDHVLQDHRCMNSSQLLTTSHGLIYPFNAGHYELSSTWLRQQLMQEHCINAYVPKRVAQYIQFHHLYSNK